jgi:hypothetical protein
MYNRPRPAALLGVVVAATLVARSAAAGRTHYGWLYGTEVNPERGVEVETWILQENGKDGVDETLAWWAPVVGLTERLELAIPFEAAYEAESGGEGETNFERFGGELRYRFNSPDPVQSGPITVLARGGVKRLVRHRSGIRGEADLVVAFEQGRFHAEVDIGAIAERVSDDDNHVELRPGGGFSVETVSMLRVGAEAYAELGVHGEVTDWLAVGPTVSLTRGRFWTSGTLAIGVFGIDSAPRINFGIAF